MPRLTRIVLDQALEQTEAWRAQGQPLTAAVNLDRSFVFPMADDARAAAPVASTIALTHSLGLRMVAEGSRPTWPTPS